MRQRDFRRLVGVSFAGIAIVALCCIGSACNLVVGIDRFTTDPNLDQISTSSAPCITEADCVGKDDECGKRACLAGSCAMVVAAEGTAVMEQIAGDCKRNQCDGVGNRVDGIVEMADIFDDGKECTVDACNPAGEPTNMPAAAGTKCAMDAMVCDGYGTCVECASDNDCTMSLVCSKNECVPQTCVNQTLDMGETAIDCGGPSCQSCAAGAGCVVDSDCQSHVCTMMACAASSCTDNQKNGDETDVDCGANCKPCADGLGCFVGADCTNEVCLANKCQAAACDDTVQNGDELHVDCGGSCDGCGVGATCNANVDCASEFCLQGICTRIIQVATGTTHACAIAETAVGNGKLYCWGGNNYGELGIVPPDLGRKQPTDPVILDNVTSVSTFSNTNTGSALPLGGHTCARQFVDGAAKFSCWGRNEYGELGNNSTVVSFQPVAIKFSGTVAATQVVAGGRHTCAITKNGHVQCWGSNNEGQLGINNLTTKSLIPVSVAGMSVPNPLHTEQLVLGAAHTCIRATAPDAIYCWGSNLEGQLGIGNKIQQNFPKKHAIATIFTQMSAGQDFTCGIANGALSCWGDNSDEQLAPGLQDIIIPALVPNASGIKSLPLSLGAAGASGTPDAVGGHSCFVLADGKLVCLGLNDRGQLGNGDILSTSTPKDVTIGPVKQVSLGTQFSCAILEKGALRCWGRNDLSQLGNGETTDSFLPVPVKWPAP